MFITNLLANYLNKYKIFFSILIFAVFSMFFCSLALAEPFAEPDLTGEDEVFLANAEFILRVCLFAAISLLIFVLYRAKLRVEKIYLVSSLVLGVFYIMLITPLSFPDANFHYYNSYLLSDKIMLKPNAGSFFEADYGNFKYLEGHKNVKTAYLRLKEPLFNYNQSQNHAAEKTAEFNQKIVFFPPALGLSVARILNLNFIYSYYLGELFALLFATFITMLAIQIMPFGKNIIMATALMPMVLHQSASFSYDSFLLALMFLFIALVFRLAYQEDKISQRQIAFLMLCAALLFPIKSFYFLIAALVFIIPNSNFASAKKAWAVKFGLLFLCLATSLVLNIDILLNMFSIDNNRAQVLNWEGKQNYSLSFIIQHPIDTIIIFIKTFIFFAPRWLFESIGYRLGGHSLVINPIYIVFLAALLFLASVKERSEVGFNIPPIIRIFLLTIALGTTFLIMLALFLSWTSIGEKIISGVQGRYFIPLIPLILLTLRNNKLVSSFGLAKIIAILIAFFQLLVLNHVLNSTFQS